MRMYCFVLNFIVKSVKEWGEKTNEIGTVSKVGRYVGTYAHIEGSICN